MKSKTYFDQYLSSGFARYNEGAGKNIRQHYRHNFLPFIPKDKTVKILDVGCGMGQCLEWLRAEGYTRIGGIEVSREGVDYCVKQGFEVSQVEDTEKWLKTHADNFDIILLNDVIEHLPKDSIVPILAAMNTALTDGGRIIIKTNNVSAITGARMRYWDFTHTTSFTELSLEQALRFAGFTNFSMHAYRFPVNRLRRVIRKIMQLIVHAVWKLIYWIEFTIVPRIVHEFFFAVVEKQIKK